MNTRSHRHRAPRLAATALILAIGAAGAVQAARWSGSAFPGFLLLPNRIVASIGLTGWWNAARGTPPFQAQLVAIDGDPVHAMHEAYARAAVHPVGAPARYTFRGATNVREPRKFRLPVAIRSGV